MDLVASTQSALGIPKECAGGAAAPDPVAQEGAEGGGGAGSGAGVGEEEAVGEGATPGSQSRRKRGSGGGKRGAKKQKTVLQVPQHLRLQAPSLDACGRGEAGDEGEGVAASGTVQGTQGSAPFDGCVFCESVSRSRGQGPFVGASEEVP